MALLEVLPGVALGPPDAIAELAASLARREYGPGAAVVSEGEDADRLYLLAQGRAEISRLQVGRPAPVASLEAGEVFGDLALGTADRRRSATVSAITPLVTFELRYEDYERFLRAHADVELGWRERMDEFQLGQLLRQVTPFVALSAHARLLLATAARTVRLVRGAEVFTQGDLGGSCYVLRSGRIEIVRHDGTMQQVLATITPVTIFGELAALTEAPRSASAVAVEPSEVLEIARSDLVQAFAEEPATAASVIELLRLRERPRRRHAVELHERATPEGERVGVLKNPELGRYYRLSPQGLFIWEQLDGRHNVKDIALAYMDRFKAFAPQAIADQIARLARGGFLDTARLGLDVAPATATDGGFHRASSMARRILTWHADLRDVDRALTRIYRGGFRFVYTRGAQLALVVLAVVGCVAFLGAKGDAEAVLQGAHHSLLWFLIPGFLLAVIVHEAGHAFTTKAFGRTINRAGVGWYWFGPVVFIDTSDMWLGTRRQRIAVSLAGPYAQLVLSGLFSIGAWAALPSVFGAALWELAFISYVSAALNLNPLLELDGYYLLIELLERPNLRPNALAWLGRELPGLLAHPSRARGHVVEMVYAVGSLVFVAFMAWIVVALYRLTIEGLVARVVSVSAAHALAWAVAGGVASLSLLAVVGELREQRS